MGCTMKKIVDFNSKNEFDIFFSKSICDFLGFGSEGSCYRGKDGKAYKCFDIDEELESEYDVKKIITDADINTEAFAFPDTIFTVRGTLAGYTSKLISPNLFSNEFLVKKNTISHINFNKLIKAYYEMIGDVDYLTSQGIKIYDLGFNLLYDSNRLYGIDTCSYEQNKSITCQENRDTLSDAMKKAFLFFLLNNDEKYKVCNNAFDLLLKDMEKIDVEYFLRDIEKKYKDNNKVYINKKSGNS